MLDPDRSDRMGAGLQRVVREAPVRLEPALPVAEQPLHDPQSRGAVERRPLAATHMERGFKLLFFGNQNQNSCPGDSSTGYVRGRNDWKHGTNQYPLYGYKDDSATRSMLVE